MHKQEEQAYQHGIQTGIICAVLLLAAASGLADEHAEAFGALAGILLFGWVVYDARRRKARRPFSDPLGRD